MPPTTTVTMFSPAKLVSYSTLAVAVLASEDGQASWLVIKERRRDLTQEYTDAPTIPTPQTPLHRLRQRDMGRENAGLRPIGGSFGLAEPRYRQCHSQLHSSTC